MYEAAGGTSIGLRKGTLRGKEYLMPDKKKEERVGKRREGDDLVKERRGSFVEGNSPRSRFPKPDISTPRAFQAKRAERVGRIVCAERTHSEAFSGAPKGKRRDNFHDQQKKGKKVEPKQL